MGIIYGLTAALCFGLSDFMVTQATRKIQTLPALVWIQLFASIMMGSFIWIQSPQISGNAFTWGAVIVISLVNFFGTLFLYRAFEKGTLSIVSPIASGFAVVTAALAIFFGEVLPTWTLVGVFLLITGVITVSRTGGRGHQTTLAGIPEAISASVCMGAYFWAVGYLTPSLGAFLPVLITRIVQLLCALSFVRIRRIQLSKLSFSTGMILILAALLDSGALISFNLGQSLSYTTSTTALASLYSLITILLAWIFFKERLSKAQWTGIAIVLLGVIAVSM
ncbi:DMT family transporter [Paenibacillus sp. SYP-B3998]|uniref:DMT family transporter n=1 Tax=Paenibacillus sp. SYP-B3998 TaxID=2678564 RepID=A0A6G3ZWC4_9BACL|nr:DMT family transporter [Paenibacillus sp. SYP-B3998]NEW05717.1 DMT family transporter [Paenibacillus sp. SYP-B3998]